MEQEALDVNDFATEIPGRELTVGMIVALADDAGKPRPYRIANINAGQGTGVPYGWYGPLSVCKFNLDGTFRAADCMGSTIGLRATLSIEVILPFDTSPDVLAELALLPAQLADAITTHYHPNAITAVPNPTIGLP